MCDTHGMRFELPEDRAPSTAVVAAVAAVEDVPPTELPPLQYSVAADALDELVAHATDTDDDVRVTFDYADYIVTVGQEEGIHLDPGDEESGPPETSDGGRRFDATILPDRSAVLDVLDRSDATGGLDRSDVVGGSDGSGGSGGSDGSGGFDSIDGFERCEPIEESASDSAALESASEEHSGSDVAGATDESDAAGCSTDGSPTEE